MKKFFRQLCLIACPALLLPIFCLLVLFALPAQYDETFCGALSDKTALLDRAGGRPRIIVVGGSSVAFGQRSDLLEAALPAYDAVNFGLYAGLGTSVMMDLSQAAVRAGDVVILSPEQNSQTLSGYFGAVSMWQAADGHPGLLARVSAEKRRMMIGEAPSFAADKFNLWRRGTHLTGDGLYSRACFNEWGDLTGTGREGNAMPGGFDPDMPVVFDLAMLDASFVDEMNAYAAACEAKGARVFYRFCPMNAAAVSPEEMARAEAYAETLRSVLDFQLLSDVRESILDAGWFFDTNFHLNAAGAVVNTAIMAAQLGDALGLAGEADIEMPDMPAPMKVAGAEPQTSDDAACFVWTEVDGAARVTGLTVEGAGRTALIMPPTFEGLSVTSFAVGVFAGNTAVREIVLPETLRRIENGSFDGCSALERLVLRQKSPNQLSVGGGLLTGTDCDVIVPQASYALYQTSYFWSVYAARIRPDDGLPQPSDDEVEAAIYSASSGRMAVDANGGEAVQCGETRLYFDISSTHLRTNTPMGQKLFRREGYAPLCWNTRADGTGEDIPFGGRADSAEGTVLYMRWAALTPENEFSWEERKGEACVTGWHGRGDRVVIPDTLGGLKVTRIASGAFASCEAEVVVLPETLFAVENDAFTGSTVREIWLYDTLFYIYDDSFEGCSNLRTLHVSAASSPRYSVSYFAAFADKLDWLRQVRDDKKLVLFGGSATRYAYDSERFKAAFPARQPVNMGVYAYTNALPQLRVIKAFMREGDVLLSAPEFDTTRTQFCGSSAMDELFWRMAEADYGCVPLLDLRDYEHVFSSLGEYLRNRRMMPARKWEETPRGYDDDGAAMGYSTYNIYGDYTLKRPNGDRDELLQSYRAAYTVEAFPKAMIESLNSVYREYQAAGVTVLFAYAPRNHSALTEGSTPEARRALHEWLCENLCVPVICDIEDSLYSGVYCYLIDNHLSDEGVGMHMDMITGALKAAGVQ